MEFKQFNVAVEAPKDHHYLDSNNISNPSTPFNYVRIIKEWEILKTRLPESIHVQVYLKRMDLLRAVVVGSGGTPYHDGLFFFDIALPANYPKQPPILYYHSHGYRLNPRLDEDGQVDLSLINMWSRKSTILEILVSIQGIVMNKEPYFDLLEFEIGRGPLLNEEVFVLSCKTMLQIIRKPPVNFEKFVVEHFRGRASSIVAAIDRLYYRHRRLRFGAFEIPCKADLIEIDLGFKYACATLGISLPNKDEPWRIDKIFVSERDRKLFNILLFVTIVALALWLY